MSILLIVKILSLTTFHFSLMQMKERRFSDDRDLLMQIIIFYCKRFLAPFVQYFMCNTYELYICTLFSNSISQENLKLDKSPTNQNLSIYSVTQNHNIVCVFEGCQITRGLSCMSFLLLVQIFSLTTLHFSLMQMKERRFSSDGPSNGDYYFLLQNVPSTLCIAFYV